MDSEKDVKAEAVVTEESVLMKLISSSSDTKKLSMTIVGAIVLGAGFLLPKANLGQDQIANIVDGILNIGKLVVTVAGAIVTMIGALRKVWKQIKDAYKPAQ